MILVDRMRFYKCMYYIEIFDFKNVVVIMAKQGITVKFFLKIFFLNPIFFKRYSEFDQIKREYFVEISSHLDSLNLTENQEYDIFNKLFRNCEFINQLNKQASYLTKYQLCVGYTSLNSSGMSKNYISFFNLILLLIGNFYFI